MRKLHIYDMNVQIPVIHDEYIKTTRIKMHATKAI